MSPLRTDYTNDEPAHDAHPLAHNQPNVSVPSLQSRVDAMEPAAARMATAPKVSPDRHGAIQTMDRRVATAGTSPGSGLVYLSFVTPPRDMTVASVGMMGATTAAAGTTLARFGIYSEATPNGNLTLIGSTANDTTLFGATNVFWRRDLTVAVPLTQGLRYAFATIVIATTQPNTLTSAQTAAFNTLANVMPRLSCRTNALTDLPVTITSVAVSPPMYMVGFE